MDTNAMFKKLIELSNWKHKLYKANLDAQEYNELDDREIAPIEHANVISSEIVGLPGMHTVMLDLDVRAMLVPSSTAGHSHLYIDRVISTAELTELLTLLAKLGIIEQGYANVSIQRKATMLRLPWVPKAAWFDNGQG